MRTRMKTLIAVGALGLATIGIYSGAGATDSMTVQPLTPAKAATGKRMAVLQPSEFRCDHCKVIVVRGHGDHRSMWKLGMRHNKNLSEADARTITKAALLMRGKHDLDVGQIQSKVTRHNRKIYLINIVNSKNQVVRSVVLNSETGRIHTLRPAHRS